MPCWYFEKADLRNTPSLLVGIEPTVEARYRREGARFIIDAGTKMGLRFDTCATGVVYYHRFYMFHSFQEFHRYVTAACCLFLAGKVEETPKKCKDIIKTCRGLLTEAQFGMFGGDPREEVMTMERILLQTIKFDLQINHAYACVLKFAKNVIGDKDKIQKVVQMAWTFVNDSLCTTLCLQWEPEIIGASMLYLATKLSKVEISDWQGRQPELKLKWYEAFVEGLSQELIEDVCHQVLDLYSASADKAQASPPPSSQTNLSTPSSVEKKPHQTPAVTPETTQEGSNKTKKEHTRSTDTSNDKAGHESRSSSVASNKSYERAPASSAPSAVVSLASGPASQPSSDTFAQQNPYISSNTYSSSYLSAEGSESIQSVMNQSTSVPSPYPSGPPLAYPPVQPVGSMPVQPLQYPHQQPAYPPVAAPGPAYPTYPPMSDSIYSHGSAHPSTYDPANSYPPNFEAPQYPGPGPMNTSYAPPSHVADAQQHYQSDYDYPPPGQHLYPPDRDPSYLAPGYSNQPLNMGPRPSEPRPQQVKPGPGLPLIRITGRRR